MKKKRIYENKENEAKRRFLQLSKEERKKIKEKMLKSSPLLELDRSYRKMKDEDIPAMYYADMVLPDSVGY